VQYSIIIPAWNEAAFLGDTLNAVTCAMGELADEGELIVVDNNSTDTTAEIATDAGAQVVFEAVNHIARARNAGAGVAKGNALIFIDADTCVSAGLLQKALSNLDNGAIVGGGAMLAPDKPVSALVRRGLELWNRLEKLAGLAAGCFVYCRRDAFDDVGGFSERVYAGEEIFLSRQLKRWGRRHNMRFEIITSPRVVTSVRKVEWYSASQIVRQVALVMIPGAVFSKRLCRTWYDADHRRDR